MNTMRNSFCRAFLVALPVFALSAANAATVPGRTPGSASVSETGAATYQIPLWISPGVNGVQPSLALTYSSQRGSGIVGPGWTLNGLSAITRCNKTPVQDGAAAAVKLTNADAFCLDGKRLRLTSGGGLGTYGQPGTTYQTEIADFTLVTAFSTAGNGPEHFIAKSKEGLTYEFGKTADARITPSASVTTPYMWLVNKVSDVDGNSYAVTYGPGATGSVGVAVPTSISYSRTSSSATTYINSVTFEYVAKAAQFSTTTEPATYGYVNGTQVANTNLLTTIRMHSSSALVHKYVLEYELAPATQRPRLNKVTECANDSDCLSPTTIGYQNGGAGVSTPGITVFTGSSFRGAPDVDGDGRQDVLYFDSGSLKVVRSTGSGFSSAITLGPSGTSVYGDVRGEGKDEIFVGQSGGAWTRYYWNGSAFNSTTTGYNLPASLVTAALTDVNGDGGLDLVGIGRTFTSSPRLYTFTIYTFLNNHTGTVAGFSQQFTHTLPVNCSGPLGNDLPCDAKMFAGQENKTGTAQLDFDGDGRKELALAKLIPNIQAAESRASVSYLRWVDASMNYSIANGGFNEEYDIIGFSNISDDNCTDTLFASGVVGISRCADAAGNFLFISGTPIATMDWNSDGRSDVLVQSGNNFGVALSVGNGFAATFPTDVQLGAVGTRNAFVFDMDADGLQDLGTWGPSGIKAYRHASAGIAPDLATSITDGYGVNVSPAYVSITLGNYTKGSGAVYPERDFLAPMYVVSSMTSTSGASDGSASTYSQSYSYFTGRINLIGRGFGGFERIRTTDGRNQLIRDVSRRTYFPYAGMVTEDKLLQPDGTTAILTTGYELNVTHLDSNIVTLRDFPYVDKITNLVQEVDENQVAPSLNGTALKETVIDPTYDSYGNATSVITTVTDKFPGSVPASLQWKSTITNTISPDTGNWCLDQPSMTTDTREAPGVTAITRTTAFDPDLVKCRVNSITIEPNDARWRVASGFRYDAFGNVDRVIVTPAAGQGQAARTTYVDWGVTGRQVEKVTREISASFSEVTKIGWDHARGLRTSLEDENDLRTDWHYDAFGRMTREDRPDGTATSLALSACNSGNSYCAFPGSRSKVEVSLLDTGDNAIRTDTQLFDLFDRPRRVLQQLLGTANSEIIRTYDVFGRLAAESIPHNPSGAVNYQSYAYDRIGRVALIRRPMTASDLSNHDTAFDYQGPTTQQTDALLRKTWQRRNAVGQIDLATDAAHTETEYAYDAFGNLLSTRIAGDDTNKIVFTYNVRGMQMSSRDPDLGFWEFDYYPLGELRTQTNANGQPSSFTYDALSRLLSRVEVGNIANFVYGQDKALHNVGELTSVSSTNYSESYAYDNFARLSSKNILIDGVDAYAYGYGYNPTTGLQDSMSYPTSTSGFQLALQYVYSNGLLEQVKNGSTTYWRANAMNALGQVTQHTLGNGVVTTRQFDAVTGLVSTIWSGPGGGTSLQNETYQFDEVGNLDQRLREAQSLSLAEDFHYDVLDRLEYSELNGVENLRLTYDVLGNIKSRSDVGGGATWVYDATKKHAVKQAGPFSYDYDDNGNAITRNTYGITWNSANYPTVIRGPNKSMTFSYGPDRQRYRQVYTNGDATETTDYIGGGLEKVRLNTSTVRDFRYYVFAGGDAIAVVSARTDGTTVTRYLLQDHLGSTASILDSSGALIVNESFDAFGKRRDANDWDGGCDCPSLAQIASITRHGYTGHEMIGGASMGLIHMNGRVQDSITGRFLSPDPIVQFPLFSQSLNRYSYVLNNPLTFTDPSGFELIFPNWPGPPRTEWPPCATSIGPPCEPYDMPEYDGIGYGTPFPGPQLKGTPDPSVAPPVTTEKKEEKGWWGWVKAGVDVATDFIPVVSQVKGAYEVYKVFSDPNSTTLDKAVAVAGVLPGGKAAKYGAKVVKAVDHAMDVEKAAAKAAKEVPDRIYRGATRNNVDHVTPRAHKGESAVSFRDSMSNPVPPAGSPPEAVLKPGRNYIEVDTKKLPAGSVVRDGDTVVDGKLMPPGHVSVTASPQEIVNATVDAGKFPK
jgi:RHS repeat-associated protein